MIIYLIGQRAGVKEYNRGAFVKQAEELRKLGHIVLSPEEMDRTEGLDVEALPNDWDWNKWPEEFSKPTKIDRSIACVQRADALFMLNGWFKSRGAIAEYHIAKWYEKPCYLFIKEVPKKN